jgi:hypothetical protein
VTDNVSLPVADPLTLIRSRIREKRIFEARFLCRRLGNEIGAQEKSALERELAALLTRVEKLQQQARAELDRGNRKRADQLYQDIEQVAIDVPGLAEARQGLEGAEAVIVKITGKSPEKRPQETKAPIPQVAVAHEEQLPVAKPQRVIKQVPLLWLIAAGLCLSLLLFFLLRGGGTREKVASPVSPPVTTRPSQTIVIRPLVPALAERVDPSSDPSASDNHPPTDKSSLPTPSMKVGPLQIQDSSRN